MAAGSIIIDLLMKTGSFETDTKRAEKRLAELKKEAQEVGVVIGAAFAAVGVAATVMVKHSIDAMDEMSKASQKVGVSVEELSGLAYAADLAGISNEGLTTAMVKLSRSIADESEAFEKLGINVKNADGSFKSADVVLKEVADKFQGMPDGIEKTALAVEIFSRAGADMIPLLNGGSKGINDLLKEAKDLGVIMDTETSKAAEEFNDNLTRMEYAAKGVANTATTLLMPALVQSSQLFVDLAKNTDAMSIITGTLEVAVKSLLVVLQTFLVVGSDVVFVFKGVGREIGALYAQAEALGVSFQDVLSGPAGLGRALASAAVTGKMSFSNFNAISEAVTADAAKARKELDDFQRRVMNIGTPAYKDPRILGETGSIASQVLGLGGRKTRAGKAGKGSDKAARDAARAAEKELAESERRLMAFNKEVEKAWQKQEDIAKSVFEATRTPMEKLDAELSKLQTLLDEGRISWDTYGRAVFQAQEKYDDTLPKNVKKTEDLVNAIGQGNIAMEELAMTGLDAFHDLALGGNEFEDVLKKLLLRIADLVFQMGVVDPIMASLKQAMGGGVTPPNPDASFLGLVQSGLSTLFSGALAGGGDVLPGHSYDVGEFGPERFIPRTAGSVVPAGGDAGGLHIINQTTGRVDRAVEHRISARDRAVILQENRADFIGQLGLPNSDVSRALARGFNLQRNRY